MAGVSMRESSNAIPFLSIFHPSLFLYSRSMLLLYVSTVHESMINVNSAHECLHLLIAFVYLKLLQYGKGIAISYA